MTGTFRVLVTGSRDWDDPLLVYARLDAAAANGCARLIVVHGACPHGADLTAATWTLFTSHAVQSAGEPHPADWKTYGKAAGFRRNAQMVSLGADLCLAFIRGGSKGATHCAGLAELAGIPVERYLA